MPGVKRQVYAPGSMDESFALVPLFVSKSVSIFTSLSLLSCCSNCIIEGMEIRAMLHGRIRYGGGLEEVFELM